MSRKGRDCLRENAVIQFLAAPIAGGLQEGDHERMRLAWFGSKLRLEKRGYEETVRGGLDGAHFAVAAAGGDGESGFNRSPFEVGVDFEIAEKFFFDHIFSVEALEVGAGAESNLGDHSGQFRRVLFAVRHGATDGIDDNVLRAGIIFGGIGVLETDDVARAFDEGVLKSAAGSEEWPVAGARELNAGQHAVEALVGAAGRGPKTVEGFQALGGVRFEERGRGQPFGLRFDFQLAGGVLNRIIGRMMGSELCVEVPENADSNGVAHGGILMERIVLARVTGVLRG